MRKLYKHKTGVSLVEVAVTIAVVMLVLTALMSAVTSALSTGQFNRNKTIATKYAQEMIEFLRTERSKSWSVFASHSGVSSLQYCFNADLSTVVNWPSEGLCSEGSVIDDTYDIFVREVTLQNTTGVPNSVTMTVVVTWRQGNRVSNVTLTSVLTKWQ